MFCLWLYVVERRLKEARKKLKRSLKEGTVLFFWKKKVERRKLRKKEIKIPPSQIERSFFVI